MNYPVIISGGGIIGCYINIRLKQAGIESLIIEKTPKDKDKSENVRTISLNPNTYQLLMDIGISIDASGVSQIRVLDKEGSGKIKFLAEEIGTDFLSYVTMFNALSDRMQEKAGESIMFSSEIKSISRSSESLDIALKNNEEIKGLLLIGSDGRMSPVAKLSNFISRDYNYDQTAFTFLVSDGSSRDKSIASQIFSDQGIFALMPIMHKDKNLFSVVWSVPNKLLNNIDKNDFVSKYINELASKIDSELNIESDIIQFPLSKHHLDSYTNEGVVIVGDAAHSIHPLAGQGINLGFADAEVLCKEVISAHRKGFPIGSYSVLKKYELKRRSMNELMLKTMDGFVNLFGSNNIYVKLLRNLGLNLFNKISFMKVFFINHASGSHKL